MSPLPHIPQGFPPTFRWPVEFCIFTIFATYVLSLVTGNCSQVDRVWTFLPTIYTAYYALLPLWPNVSPFPLFPYVPTNKYGERIVSSSLNPRALLMLGLQIIWMYRLSYNTWRRGLFNLKDEDYRWAILRQKVPKWVFHIFNFAFIAVMQNIILFLLGVPAQIVATQRETPLGVSDYVLAVLAVVTVATEFVADNQQYSFQTYKRKRVIEMNEWPLARIKWTPEDAERGFVTRGLWAWSRHPNFFCEQSFWLLMCFFPILSSPRLPALNSNSIIPLYPLVPGLVLCTLFFSSTIFTESITQSKYPVAYKAYQSRVAMFVPILTPVWGALLQLRGRKEEADALVYGSGNANLKVKAD